MPLKEPIAVCDCCRGLIENETTEFKPLVLVQVLPEQTHEALEIPTFDEVAVSVNLRERVRPTPVVPCDTATPDAVWVEPELFCVVSYAEQTHGGELRHPAFEGLVDG